ncbi:MAG TPA: class I SAM-dependent methyltransferase [Bryobacteraceae bacterium]|jgi:SAM-dependent methyltransferase|nr:class I SAM-dependent methyltransferase [Bryobacteraceae bacterium]
MTYSAIVERLPRWLGRHVLHFELAIEDAVADFAARLPAGARVLDAGAGEARHAHYFTRQRYCGVDLGVGDQTWNYGRLDALADLTRLPFRDGCFDAAINIVTLEHVREPERVLGEIARALASGAPFLAIVPHEWEVHQAPHDYFRYTRHGMAYLLERAGMVEIEIRPVGGYFRLLARRLLNGLQFFSGGVRWLGFIPAAVLLVPPALVIPYLDFLDRERNFTLGYICTAKKSS